MNIKILNECARYLVAWTKITGATPAKPETLRNFALAIQEAIKEHEAAVGMAEALEEVLADHTDNTGQTHLACEGNVRSALAAFNALQKPEEK